MVKQQQQGGKANKPDNSPFVKKLDPSTIVVGEQPPHQRIWVVDDIIERQSGEQEENSTIPETIPEWAGGKNKSRKTKSRKTKSRKTKSRKTKSRKTKSRKTKSRKTKSRKTKSRKTKSRKMKLRKMKLRKMKPRTILRAMIV